MKISKIVCDNCGMEIEDKHPRKFQISEYKSQKDWELARYTIVKTMHLCPECEKEIMRYFG